MELSRCSLGISGLILGIGAYSWVFGDTGSLIIASALLCLLLIRGVLFVRAARSVTRSLHFSRSTQKRYLRQGSSTGVTADIVVTLPAGLHLTIADLIPAGGAIQYGSPEAACSGPGPHSLRISYELTILTAGDIRFPGVGLRIADPFFTTGFEFSRGEYEAPLLQVEPASRFERGKGIGALGEMEIEKRTPVRGYSITSFRNFVDGDDPRTIDWKLSAKHGKLFVRERSGRAGNPPLFIVDLPSAERMTDMRCIDQMMGAVLEGLATAEQESRIFSLLIISGPDLQHFLPDERSFRRARKVIMQIQNPGRITYDYRRLDAGSIRVIHKDIERTIDHGSLSPEALHFLTRLGEIYKRIAPSMRPSPFEIQLHRLFSQRPRTEVYLFSTYSGDLSHIRTIIRQSRKAAIDTVLEIPDEVASPLLLKQISRFGATELKVVR